MLKTKKGLVLSPSKGFTLIEILIVVAIIGLLASFILVGLGGARARARDARRIADINQVQQGLELYFSKAGNYPTGAQATDWTVLGTTLKGASIGVRSLPNDPAAGTATYYYCSTGTGYVLGANLENDDNAGLKNYDDSAAFPCTFTAPGVACSTKAALSNTYCTTF